ncbi:abortive infection family protein [Phytopseudomonas seleniipraecipitans]|uniref:Abortive infection C-terminus n=1 Tax=Phytopseudomonas seleniipraecipitans TaxID=640205 RepID=A0A1G7H8W9_9GAMM|nr:abortive infection family protein [Pseudomonas seleniipraecipitans]SDE96811.1 Abortive infection C-terminus [Pseudomonas seleniipraecipitans]
MSIDILLHEVLRKIHSGVKSFGPESSSPNDLKKFQDIAKTVVHAYSQGYIEKMIPRKESMSGNGYYAVILVNGGLTYEGERLLQESSGEPTPADEALAELLDRTPSYSIREKWEKALHRRITDPSGAITAARSLLETTLKWIIEQRGGKAIESNKELFSRAIDALGVEVKGKPIEKTIEGLSSIIWGIGDMRNKHGDAHGAASSSIPPTKSEAGFCVNLAGAAALYLLEEFESGE